MNFYFNMNFYLLLLQFIEFIYYLVLIDYYG